MGPESKGPTFIQVPLRLLRDHKAGFGVACLVGRLLTYAGGKGSCCVRHKILAEELGISASQVKNLLQKAVLNGYIARPKRTQGASIYTLLIGRDGAITNPRRGGEVTVRETQYWLQKKSLSKEVSLKENRLLDSP